MTHEQALVKNYTAPFRAQKSGITRLYTVKDANGKTIATTGTYPSAARKAEKFNAAAKLNEEG